MLKRALIIGLGLVVVIFALAIIFGGPGTPHPMGSITDPFNSVDFSDLPQLCRFTARDGTQLAYRSYAPATSAPSQGSVVLIHGSSATSSSMHPMAKELSAAGFTTYALDIRGHGGSGDKGQIGYIGQLEDDLTDFMRAVSPPAPVTLAGFSSGGGSPCVSRAAVGRIFLKAICFWLRFSVRTHRVSGPPVEVGRVWVFRASSRLRF